MQTFCWKSLLKWFKLFLGVNYKIIKKNFCCDFFPTGLKFTPGLSSLRSFKKPWNRLHIIAEMISHATVFSCSSVGPNWNFTLCIFVYHSYVLTVYSFVNYEMNKHFRKEQVKERSLLEICLLFEALNV